VQQDPEQGGQNVGRLNGASIGPTRDLRGEDAPASKGEIGGTCTRCGRSFVPREDADGLCRDCSRAVGRKAAASPGQTPRPESLSAPLSERAPTCRMHDCSRVPGPSGLCRTHAPQIDAEHPWNKYVAQKTQEPQPREAVVVEVVAEKKEPIVAKAPEQFRCGIGGCDYTSDRAASMGAHKFRAHATRASGGAAPKAAKAPSTATSSRRTSSPAAPKKAPAPKLTVRVEQLRDVKDALPPEVSMLLAIAELGVDARARLVTWAWDRWGTESNGGGQTMNHAPRHELPESEVHGACALCQAPVVKRNATGRPLKYCSPRCRTRAADRARRARDRARTSP
jgi:hypothetical protein